MFRLRRNLLVGGTFAGVAIAAVVAVTVSHATTPTQGVAIPEVPNTATSTAPESSGSATTPPDSPAPPPPAPALAKAMVDAADDAKSSQMTLGVAVTDLTTGDVELDGNGNTQFYTASLAKLMLIVNMLDNGVTLSSSDQDLITRALTLSDDNAMDELWEKYGGPSAMTQVAAQVGMTSSHTTSDPSQWGETVITAADYAKLYWYILHNMSADDQKTIITPLSHAKQAAADGFDQFFGILGQPQTQYAKQGWMYLGSKLYLHSAGVVHGDKTGHDYIVVILTVQPQSIGTAKAEKNVTAVGKAAISVVTNSG